MVFRQLGQVQAQFLSLNRTFFMVNCRPDLYPILFWVLSIDFIGVLVYVICITDFLFLLQLIDCICATFIIRGFIRMETHAIRFISLVLTESEVRISFYSDIQRMRPLLAY